MLAFKDYFKVLTQASKASESIALVVTFFTKSFIEPKGLKLLLVIHHLHLIRLRDLARVERKGVIIKLVTIIKLIAIAMAKVVWLL